MKANGILHSVVLAMVVLILNLSLITSTAVAQQVNFVADPSSGPAPLEVHFFDATASDDPITAWLWDFGDGTSSREQNPTHTFDTAGTYTVTLFVYTANSVGSNSLDIVVS